MAKGLSTDTLNHIGPLLYGKQWRTELAADLGVHITSVSQWSLGNTAPRPRHTVHIVGLLEKRIAAIQSALEAIHQDKGGTVKKKRKPRAERPAASDMDKEKVNRWMKELYPDGLR